MVCPDNFRIRDNGTTLFDQNIVDHQPVGNNYLNIGTVGRGTFTVPAGTSNVTMKVSSFSSWQRQSGRPALDNTSKWSYKFTRYQGLRIHFKYYEVKKVR